MRQISLFNIIRFSHFIDFFVKIFFIMKMDVWNIVLGPGKDIRSGTHYNSRSKPNTVLKFLTSRAASIRKTGTRP